MPCQRKKKCVLSQFWKPVIENQEVEKVVLFLKAVWEMLLYFSQQLVFRVSLSWPTCQILVESAPIFTWLFFCVFSSCLFVKRHLSLESGSSFSRMISSQDLNYICKSGFFQKRSQSQIPHRHIFWVTVIEPNTIVMVLYIYIFQLLYLSTYCTQNKMVSHLFEAVTFKCRR